MDSKKIPTILGTIIIVIFAITTSTFVWIYEKNKPAVSESQTIYRLEKKSNINDSLSISDNWTLVSHENFWNNPKKIKNPNPDRFPNIKFSYPDNWEFRCCGDMDYASENFISPIGRDTSLPYIRITNFGLSGCSNTKDDCSIDKVVRLTAKEKFNRLASAVPNNQVLPEKKLTILGTNAFVYRRTEKDNRSSRAYLINLKDGVIRIDFINDDLLPDETFIENFLNRIAPEDGINQEIKFKISDFKKWKTYTNKNIGLELKYPSELYLNPSQEKITFDYLSPNDPAQKSEGSILLHFDIFLQQESADQYIEKYQLTNLQNYKVVEIKLNGATAEQITYTDAFAGGRMYTVLMQKGADLIAITYAGDNRLEDTFNKMLSTFKKI